MARKPAAVRSRQSGASVALERLGRLAASGTSPERLAREVDKIIAEWRGDPNLEPDQLGERLAALLDDLTAGVTAAEEQADDVDLSDAAALRQSAGSLKALRAALDAVAAAQGGRAQAG